MRPSLRLLSALLFLPGFLLLVSGCAPRRNPFSELSGPVTFTVVNRSAYTVTVTLISRDDRIGLGAFNSREVGEMEIPWTGRGEVRARVTRIGGGMIAESFPRQVEPRDRFQIIVRSDGRRVDLVRF